VVLILTGYLIPYILVRVNFSFPNFPFICLSSGSTITSPHRQLKSHGDLTAIRVNTKELAQDVQDFTPHYRVTDAILFSDRLLPVKKSTVDAILQNMKDEQIYDSQTQRWKGFPVKKAKENSLYGPFCAIAEAIRGFVEARVRPSASEMGSSKWVDSKSAQLRPDTLFALQAVAEQTVLLESQVRILS